MLVPGAGRVTTTGPTGELPADDELDPELLRRTLVDAAAAGAVVDVIRGFPVPTRWVIVAMAAALVVYRVFVGPVV